MFAVQDRFLVEEMILTTEKHGIIQADKIFYNQYPFQRILLSSFRAFPRFGFQNRNQDVLRGR
jgi:hypothetical protein